MRYAIIVTRDKNINIQKTTFQSAIVNALNKRRPIPGMLKITSKTRDPEKAPANADTKIVMAGISAFLAPAYKAVLFYSDPWP